MNHPNIVWEVTSESGSYSDYEKSTLAVYKTKEEADKHLKALEDFGNRLWEIRAKIQADLADKHPTYYAKVEECARDDLRKSFYPSVSPKAASIGNMRSYGWEAQVPKSHQDDGRKMYTAMQDFLKENYDEAHAIGFYAHGDYSVEYTKVFESFETRKEEEAVLEDSIKEHAL